MSRESGHAFQFMYIYSALEVFQKAVEAVLYFCENIVAAVAYFSLVYALDA